MKTDEAAIRRIISDQTDSWNRGDATRWAKDFLEDGEFLNVLGAIFTGRSRIEARHAELFATCFRKSRETATIRRIWFLGRNAAVADSQVEVSGFRGLPEGVRPRGAGEPFRVRVRNIVLRRDGRWWIAASQRTEISA